MTKPLRVGVAGVGTVGAALIAQVAAQRAQLTARCGRGIEIVAVSARSKSKNRGVDLKKMKWFSDPIEMAGDPGIDVFVELMGGVGRSGENGGRIRARFRQIGGDRQQGAARQARRQARATCREERRLAELRSCGRRGNPDHQDITRRACRQFDQPHLRHPQRHLQLHPDADGTGEAILCRLSQAGARARLRRSQSGL